MNFDIDQKTYDAIKKLDQYFIVKQVESVWWKIHSMRLWSGEVTIDSENMADYRKYAYQDADVFVDKNLADDSTIHIRVNPYKQRGIVTFRALLVGFKETIWPTGPEW